MPESSLYILSGPVQSGKTTSLLNWARKRKDISGILTPVVNGKRVFLDLASRVHFPMEAGPEETETLVIGRFVFSSKQFQKAADCLLAASKTPGWLIIDEIGPLELKDQGFHLILKKILEQRSEKLLLVVREGEVNAVRQKYRLDLAAVISTETLPAIH